MGTRIVVGGCLAGLLIGVLVLDGYLATLTPPEWVVPGLDFDLVPWVFNGAISTGVILVLTLLVTRELLVLTRHRGHEPLGRSAYLFAAALTIGPYVSQNLAPLTGGYDESGGLLLLAVALAFMFLAQGMLHGTRDAIEHPAITLFIIFYTGGLASFMTKLRMEIGGSTGLIVLLLSMFVVKMTDTGAFFTGYALGRTKMVPWLSPKKTWEGFVGGVVVAVILSVVVGETLISAGLLAFTRPPVPPWVVLAVIGLVLALFSAAGDLCASLIKRSADVKDSGQALPGLGGILDIMDSPLLGAPVAWFLWTRVFHVAS